MTGTLVLDTSCTVTPVLVETVFALIVAGLRVLTVSPACAKSVEKSTRTSLGSTIFSRKICKLILLQSSGVYAVRVFAIAVQSLL